MIGGTKEGLRAKFVENPLWPQIREDVRRVLADRELDYATAIGQPFMGRWDDEGYAAFACVRAMIVEGTVIAFHLPLGAEPGPDKDREGNAAAFAALPPAFGAEVFERQRNSPAGDGDLWWNEPITLTTAGGDPVTVKQHGKAIPLEIGSTHAGTTYEHLLRFGGVARWAYNSRDLVVLLNLKHFEEWDDDEDEDRSETAPREPETDAAVDLVCDALRLHLAGMPADRRAAAIARVMAAMDGSGSL